MLYIGTFTTEAEKSNLDKMNDRKENEVLPQAEIQGQAIFTFVESNDTWFLFLILSLT